MTTETINLEALLRAKQALDEQPIPEPYEDRLVWPWSFEQDEDDGE